MGKPIHNFPSMPIIDTGNITRDTNPIDTEEEERIFTEMYNTMNEGQKKIMDTLIDVSRASHSVVKTKRVLSCSKTKTLMFVFVMGEK